MDFCEHFVKFFSFNLAFFIYNSSITVETPTGTEKGDENESGINTMFLNSSNGLPRCYSVSQTFFKISKNENEKFK